MEFWLTLPVAALLAALFGFIIGLPTLRLKGDYLAIATLGFGEIVRNILNNWDSLTNGPMEFKESLWSLFSVIKLAHMQNGVFVFSLDFRLGCLSSFERLAKSRIGRALEAIREDEIAASSMGINTTRYKVWAFALGASVAGIAGSLQAVFILSVTPGVFTFMVSIMVLCMVVLGGMGNFKAVILGSFIIQFISYFPQLVGLSNVIPPQFKQVLFGMILVIMMIWRPQGILGRAQRGESKKLFKRKEAL